MVDVLAGTTGEGDLPLGWQQACRKGSGRTAHGRQYTLRRGTGVRGTRPPTGELRSRTQHYQHNQHCHRLPTHNTAKHYQELQTLPNPRLLACTRGASSAEPKRCRADFR